MNFFFPFALNNKKKKMEKKSGGSYPRQIKGKAPEYTNIEKNYLNPHRARMRKGKFLGSIFCTKK